MHRSALTIEIVDVAVPMNVTINYNPVASSKTLTSLLLIKENDSWLYCTRQWLSTINKGIEDGVYDDKRRQRQAARRKKIKIKIWKI